VIEKEREEEVERGGGQKRRNYIKQFILNLQEFI
jgi:hypothetical protein